MKKEAKKKTDKKKLMYFFVVKNGYSDLKRRHQTAKIRKIFKWADRGKH